MPRYFFDLVDGNQTSIDDTGLDLADDDAALGALTMTLPRLSADRAQNAAHLALSMPVRDETGRPVCRAELTWVIRKS